MGLEGGRVCRAPKKARERGVPPALLGRVLDLSLLVAPCAMFLYRAPLPPAAVLPRVIDCPPLPPRTRAQGVILYTDQGTAVIVTTTALFRKQLFTTLTASRGLSLREIGELDINV